MNKEIKNQVVPENTTNVRNALGTFLRTMRDISILYRPASNRYPANVLVFLLGQVERLADRLLGDCGITRQDWLGLDAVSDLSAAITTAIDDKSVEIMRVVALVRKVEAVTFHCVDVARVTGKFFQKEGCLFRSIIRGDLQSSRLLDSLISQQQGYWQAVRRLLYGKSGIRVLCVDRQLCTPAQCAVLAQFLFQLENYFSLRPRLVVVYDGCYGKIPDTYGNCLQEEMFSDLEGRDWFLSQFLQHALGARVVIQHQAERELPEGITLAGADFDFSICVPGGISGWWHAVRGGFPPSEEQLAANPVMELSMKNLSELCMGQDGIEFTMHYSPRHTDSAV